ncbi:hypothetical protein LK09_17740 [Microbacterium mangrovi]|uniref:ESAT-6-like protein n=1 Tax=Microbacterium mangrovi TaxID=1348253 RepID=A0A0B2A2N4_9MICO|nr:WXG100 family type VII secretion target [Microbacterium mangrovi]KHK95862.1 hypothetical protein LK09_17740 [Microbacterium mangrovi]
MRIRISHASVAELVSILALTVRNLEDQLATLDDEASRLRDGWDGAARTAYDHAHRQWTTALTRMKDALADATRRLNTANQISLETSARAANVWM